ncbi:MAG: site-2 protease family protein [Clostridia bacterium]|nr:site-2 protease family protein [Clostridia bacterium]
MFENIFYILIAFVILMFMITVHEAGHYVAGRLLGFKINEFAVGMGPKLLSKTLKSGQVFSLRAIPLGGFCAFEGEDEDNPSPDAFNNQKPWKRLIVLFSGAFMNFVSALVIVVIAFSCFGDALPQIVETYPKTGVVQTQENTLQAGDTLLEINGKKILLAVDVSSMIQGAGDVADVLVLRDGEHVLLKGVQKSNYTIIDENGDTQTYFGWGVAISYGGSQRTTFTFGEALSRSLPYCMRTASYVLETLGGLITGIIGLDQIGGPITTIDIASQVARQGLPNILMLITLISVNLAVFNLLPVPSLDGCRMIFVLIEWIRGKPVSRTVEGYIHFVGILLLFGFVILVDLLKLFG